MRAEDRTYARARTLRRRMTLPEIVLWQALRQRQLGGCRFRRQHPVGPYILDFYCPAARLAIEIDGRGHEVASQMDYDRRRDVWLAKHEVTVLRVAAADVLGRDTLEGVLLAIEEAAAGPLHHAARATSPASG